MHTKRDEGRDTSSDSSSPRHFLSPALLQEIQTALQEGQLVRHKLPDGGRIYLERSLPFLCVYLANQGQSSALRRMVMGESSYIILPPSIHGTEQSKALFKLVIEQLSQSWGAVLVLQLRTTTSPPKTIDFPDLESLMASSESSTPLTPPEQAPQIPKFLPKPPAYEELRHLHAPPPPLFRLGVRQLERHLPIIGQFQTSLSKIAWMKTPAQVEVVAAKQLAIEGVYAKEVQQLGALFLDLRLEHPYIEGAGELASLRELRPFLRSFSRVLQRTFFEFTQTKTLLRPPHFLSLGKNVIGKMVRTVDTALATVNRKFDFLLYLTPINTAAAWAEFRRNQYDKEPFFLYRPLEFTPHLLKRELYQIPIEQIGDPTIAHLLTEKQEHIDRQLTMLLDRNTPAFLYGGLQQYGPVSPGLYEQAHKLLTLLAPRSHGESKRQQIPPEEFAEHARREIELYRAQWPAFLAKVEVRNDVAGIMVSQGNLLVGVDAQIPLLRIEPLLHHEIGTHCLTTANGSTQPLTLLSHGLAGYEGLQEGIAVLAEYLCGGLRRPRLRLLAGRVVAAQSVIQGATFMETYRLLQQEYQFARRASFDIAMRVHRSGGFIKDKVYLQGFLELFSYLQQGGELTPLWVGKIAQKHIPLIKELIWRNVLRDPPLRPRYLDLPIAQERLDQIRHGLTFETLAKQI